MRLAVAAAALFLLAGLAGCLGDGKTGRSEDDDVAPLQPVSEEERRELLRRERQFVEAGEGEKKIEEAASDLPFNFSFPGQLELPEVLVHFNGSLAPTDGVSHEAPRDEGATSVNPVYKTTEVTEHLPPGQPAEVSVTLFWKNDLGSSADLDIYVKLPGIETERSLQDQYLKFGANFELATFSVVGDGQPAFVGVQGSNDVTALRPLEFQMRILFTYVSDVVGPRVPYLVNVPPEGRSLVFVSEKAAGEDHIEARLVLVGAAGEVLTVEYNDVNIPDQQQAAVVGPGEWVVFAYAMHGGFLRVKADAPLPQSKALALATDEVVTVVADAVGASAWPAQGTAGWDTDGGRVPLLLWASVKNPSATKNVSLEVSNEKGRVLVYNRWARLDADGRTTVGYTDDENKGAQNGCTPRQAAQGMPLPTALCVDRSIVFNASALMAGPHTLTYEAHSTGGLALHALYFARP